MAGNAQYYRQKLERLKGQRDALEVDLKRLQGKAEELDMHLQQCEEAATIIRHVAQQTQQQLEYQISELVSLAMFSVFDSPYEFELEFVQRRGRTEADIWFSRGGERINPLDASGGGAVDVAAFALRVALWNLAIPKTTPLLVLDEPLKFLSSTYQDKASQMLKEISSKLGLQLLMITHIDQLVEAADNVVDVAIKGKVSSVHIR
jgi:DNA repair protein SbcC/Rad50